MITQENIPYTADEIKAMVKTCEKYNKAREKARELMDKGYDVLMPEIFPELNESEDEKIKREIVAYINELAGLKNEKIPTKWLDWLEKQGEQKKVSIWKHWKNGIAGNGEGRQAYLIRTGNTYDLSSCLSFECDYIELSELDNLMLEKQSETFNADITNRNDEILNAISTGLTDVGVELGWSDFGGIPIEEIKDWLEKQGENKLADKVEPKFHKGDWIIHQGTENIYQVVACIDNQYQLKYGDNYTVQKCTDVDRCARLWDITKDAKDGDVLVHNGYPFIFMGVKDGIVQALEENLLEGTNPVNFGEPKIDKDYQPATNEQHDLLFQKMKEAGYEWDSEKKELKKIEPKKIEPKNPIVNVPPRELILSIWDLGNEWKELTNGCILPEYGTQLDYIQKHWYESEYYLKATQGNKSTEDVK